MYMLVGCMCCFSEIHTNRRAPPTGSSQNFFHKHLKRHSAICWLWSWMGVCNLGTACEMEYVILINFSDFYISVIWFTVLVFVFKAGVFKLMSTLTFERQAWQLMTWMAKNRALDIRVLFFFTILTIRQVFQL